MEETTEIIQLPAIYRDGEVVAIRPEWKDLEYAKLQILASGAGGKLGYVKVRATYSSLETRHCSHYKCYRPAQPNSDECGDHG
jgi:hypothetical protein